MNKKIIIGFVAAILLAILAYVGYWGFQSYSTKKVVESLINDNSSDYKIGKATTSVAFYPISKDIHVQDLSYNLSSKASISVANFNIHNEGSASDDYYITNLGMIRFQDNSEKFAVAIKFHTDTKILIKHRKTASGEDKMMIDYSGSGYDILSDKSELLYKVRFKDAKSSVIIGEEYAYKHKDAGSEIHDAKGNLIASTGSSLQDIAYQKTTDGTINLKLVLNIKDSKQIDIKNIRKELTMAIMNMNGKLFTDVISQEAAKTKPSHPVDIALNFKLKAAKNPSRVPAYIIDTSLNNFKFATPEYKVLLDADVKTENGDVFPFGQIKLQIENLDVIFDHIKKAYMEEMGVDRESPTIAHQEVNAIKEEVSRQEKALLNANDRLSQSEIINNTDLAKDDGAILAQKKKSKTQKDLELIEEVRRLLKDIAAKNTSSTNQLSVFDFSREKSGPMDLDVNTMKGSQIIIDFSAKQQKQKKERKASKVANPHLHLEESL